MSERYSKVKQQAPATEVVLRGGGAVYPMFRSGGKQQGVPSEGTLRRGGAV